MTGAAATGIVEKIAKEDDDFINLFTHSFYKRTSQKHKKLLDLTVFFTLLGSARVNAGCKHIYEIDPRRTR